MEGPLPGHDDIHTEKDASVSIESCDNCGENAVTKRLVRGCPAVASLCAPCNVLADNHNKKGW